MILSLLAKFDKNSENSFKKEEYGPDGQQTIINFTKSLILLEEHRMDMLKLSRELKFDLGLIAELKM